MKDFKNYHLTLETEEYSDLKLFYPIFVTKNSVQSIYVLTKFSSYKYVLTKMTVFLLTTVKKLERRVMYLKTRATGVLVTPFRKYTRRRLTKSPLKIEIRPLKICTTIPCLEARAEMNFFTDFKLNLFIPSGILCSDTPYCLKSVKHLRR